MNRKSFSTLDIFWIRGAGAMDIVETRTEVNAVHRAHIDQPVTDEQQYLFIKRIFDIVMSFFGLVLLLPVFAVIALVILIEDPRGNAIFRQTRLGKDGKPFYMYKFRSMVVDAEQKLDQLLSSNEVSGAMFKMKNDPRITRVGKFIRKTSLDELPQLWNVLRGHMSLVGPRPPLPREVLEYTPYEMARLSVIPGCTGLWQVSGRNNLGFAEMVEMDLQYIAWRSLRMDLRIIGKTVLTLLTKNGY
jgi:lipopolysaccharide/colanic/teichoic acid biosynthesis glycosyltransferase